MIAAMAETYCLQHIAGAGVDFSRFLFADQQRHRHVFQRRKVRQQVVELIDKAQLAVTQIGFGARRL